MTRLAAGPRRPGASPVPSGAGRPLAVTGAIAACAAAGTGLAVLTMLALAWLISHHVGFALPGVGRIGMLPLGLVLLPGALLWRAGRWVVRTGGVRRLRHVGYAALALAVPYAMVATALALASSSARATPSLPEAVVCPFLLALVAGGLGGARALAPWHQLAGLLGDRLRSLTAGTAGALAVLAAAGSLLAGVSLALHLGEFKAVHAILAPGLVGAALLLIAQLAYVPNAVVWAISFTLGPGFAFGTGTVVAPTGSALGSLPSFPLLAALPPGTQAGVPTGVHQGVPPWLSVAVLAVPYLAGALGGLLMTRAAPAAALETAPLWGFACGALTGCVLGVLAAFAGGPLGDGRLAAVGPSGWQVGAVASLEVGVAAAVTAGIANWRRQRAVTASAGPAAAPPRPRPATRTVPGPGPVTATDDGHTIYVNPWAGAEDQDSAGARAPAPHRPSSLP